MDFREQLIVDNKSGRGLCIECFRDACRALRVEGDKNGEFLNARQVWPWTGFEVR